jgi:hypothetical protein
MVGAAATLGGLPSDERVTGGMLILGRVIELMLISGIVIPGIVRFGAGTNNANMNKSSRYRELALRVVNSEARTNHLVGLHY